MAVLPDQLRWTAERVPDAVAFEVHGVGTLTAAEWNDQSARLARGFVRHGVKAGDRVALILPPTHALRFVVAYAATHKAGAVAVPINVRLNAAEIANLLSHCEPTVVVTAAELRHLIPDGALVLDENDDWLDPDASDFQVDRDRDDLAEILYTSGTTGLPKGIAIEHGNAALQILARPDWTGAPWLHASPLSTFSGLTFVYQPMRMGMRTLYLPKFDAQTCLDIIRDARPPMAFLVPSMVELLLACPGLPEADLSSLLMVSIGSAPIAPSTLIAFQEAVPDAGVSNSYSMTEAGTTYCVLPKGELRNHPGSVGKPMPPAEIRVVDEETGDELPPESIGAIVIKPAGKPRTYFRDPEATKELYDGEWLRTGDLGRFDADGYLYITGRAKDVIIRGGNNIHAVDVENVLYEHPAVQEAAVAAVHHDVLGEDVGAWIVVRPGAELTPEEVTAFCREHLADYKVPRKVWIVESLPRNATGKVLKRELTASASAGAVRHVANQTN